MERLEMKIGGMSCGHCASAVRKALAKVPGVSVVDVTVGSATVEVEDEAVTVPLAQRAMEQAGYPVESVSRLAMAAAGPKLGGGCCCGGGKCG